MLLEHFKEAFVFFSGEFFELENGNLNHCSSSGIVRKWKSGTFINSTLSVSYDITRTIKALEIEIDLKDKKAILVNLLGSKAQGVLIWSCFQSDALMHSMSKFFFSLEKKNGQSRFIHAMYSVTGQFLTEASEIRQSCGLLFSVI